MFNEPENIAVIAIVLVAGGILSWGFWRAKKFGFLGILAWWQSVVLMAPWLTFFALFAVGIYLNLVAILVLLIASVGIYIWLGNQLRAAGQNQLLQEKAAQRLQEQENDRVTQPNSTQENKGLAIAPELVPIPEEDLQKIKEIFGIDTFFATETISYQQGAIFKGNLRGEASVVHQTLSRRLKERLGDKYRFFLVEGPEDKPVGIVLPSTNDPQPLTLAQKNLALVMLVATIATSMEASGLLLGFDWFNNLGRYRDVLPLSLGLWAVLITHELGHFLVAKRHQIRLSWPFFLPTWQIGSFGAITRFETFLPNRNVLFDISLAGPAAGGILSLIMLVAGLVISHPGSLFKIPSQFFQGSILVGTLAKVILGSNLESTLIDIHPLAVLGWLGLVITALNLLPAGQLDGGRIVLAIYGRKIARRATIATLVLLGIVALINPGNPIPLYWLVVIAFLQRDLERPNLDELTEPDDTRAAWALLVLFLMLATIVPLSPSLAGSLGIGAN